MMTQFSPNFNKLGKPSSNSNSSNVVEGPAKKELTLKIMKANRTYRKSTRNRLWPRI